MKSSVGFHTVTFYKKLTYVEALQLLKTFKNYNDVTVIPDKRNKSQTDTNSQNNEDSYDDFMKKLLSKTPVYYFYMVYQDCRGISWILRASQSSPGFRDISEKEHKPCSIKATINPKIFTGIKDYATVASEEYLMDMIVNFNDEAKRISPILGKFDSYMLNRVDYCFNFDIREIGILDIMGIDTSGLDETNDVIKQAIERIMLLIKRSNIPNHYTEWEEYDSTCHRMKPDKNSFYLTNNSVNINCYTKYYQLKEEFSGCPNIEDSLYIIRFEIQCKYPKVYSMSRNMSDNLGFMKSVIREMMSDETSYDVVHKYFNKIIRKGDYYPLDKAKRIIESKCFCENKEDRLIDTLVSINNRRGISKAREGLEGKKLEDFKRSIRELEGLRINPVTIPREWGIKHIPNLLDAYYDKLSDEQHKIYLKKQNDELIQDYFNKKNKNKNKKRKKLKDYYADS